MIPLVRSRLDAYTFTIDLDDLDALGACAEGKESMGFLFPLELNRVDPLSPIRTAIMAELDACLGFDRARVRTARSIMSSLSWFVGTIDDRLDMHRMACRRSCPYLDPAHVYAHRAGFASGAEDQLNYALNNAKGIPVSRPSSYFTDRLIRMIAPAVLMLADSIHDHNKEASLLGVAMSPHTIHDR